MNRLTTKKGAQVLGRLVEGNSIRSTVRMTGVAKNTAMKLLVDVGQACSEFQDEVMRNLSCKRIQCDKIRASYYAEEKNVPDDKKSQRGYGDIWTWMAICADTKLIPSFMVGNRDREAAKVFIDDLASRLAHSVLMTTDGHKAYLEAIEGTFGCEIDYAVLLKLYGPLHEGDNHFSPSECIGTGTELITETPDNEKISTGDFKRQNLSMRKGMRGLTRLTNAFSKKVENLAAAVALHVMHYNFGRIHRTLKVTPAMEAGITDHLWPLREIAGLLDRRTTGPL